MDHILAAFMTLILWRLVIAVLAAVAVAILVSLAVPAVNPIAAVAIVILGVAQGIVWQSKSAFPPSQPAPLRISRPLAFVGLAFAAIFWSGVLEFATGSAFAAAALLVATPTLASPFVVAITKSALPSRQVVFSTIAFASGLGLIYAIRLLASLPGA